jgi:hypothetical protein
VVWKKRHSAVDSRWDWRAYLVAARELGFLRSKLFVQLHESGPRRSARVFCRTDTGAELKAKLAQLLKLDRLLFDTGNHFAKRFGGSDARLLAHA